MKNVQVLIITGLSGSGKSYVHNCFEDMGYFCVDNLPTVLVPSFADLIRSSPELRRTALVVVTQLVPSILLGGTA